MKYGRIKQWISHRFYTGGFQKMAKLITRTFKTHTINAAKVAAKNGAVTTEPVAPVVVKDENITPETALRFVQKEHGKKDQYVILSIDTVEELYGIDVSVFLQYATKIEPKKADDNSNVENVQG
jgi:hypothetical protein